MDHTNTHRRWKLWLKPSRLIPMLTIAGGGAAIVLSLLKIIQLNIADDIIIALLLLLAVDALTERLSLLEKLNDKLGKISKGRTLRKRIDIMPPTELAANASEICILAVHGISVLPPYSGFYKKMLHNGCSLRAILLDPNSTAIEAWHKMTGHRDSNRLIETTLQDLKELVEFPGSRGTLEIRLSSVFFPFSLFCSDLTKDTGSMNVEYHSYKRSIDERPHIHLTARDDPYWFRYYNRQFEDAWSDSKPWTS